MDRSERDTHLNLIEGWRAEKARREKVCAELWRKMGRSEMFAEIQRKTMDIDNEFEQALQAYESAVSAYQIAWRRYVDTIGLHAAQPKLREAMHRICALDSVPLAPMDQAEVVRCGAQAVRIVDAEMLTSPDIYAHRPGGTVDG